MNLRDLLPSLLAVVVLVLTGVQTSTALRDSGAWRTPPKAGNRPPEDPYRSLDLVLAASDSASVPRTLRDPFAFGRAPTPPRTVVRAPVVPPPPAQPVVTAIVTDEETARAILRFQDISYSVKAGDLFAQYRVVSITADAVVVDDGKERLTLKPPTRGE